MGRFVAPLVLLLALWCDPSTAYACTCAVPPIDIAIRQADVIVSGPATRIEVTQVPGVLRATIYVRETLKGQADRNFTIYTHPPGGSCVGYDFRVGREYVVFAQANGPTVGPLHIAEAPPNSYIVPLCGGTADLQNPISDGNRRLYEARQRLKPKG
jgi:hypothetical protein